MDLNNLMRFTGRLLVGVTLFTTLLISSCKDDEPAPNPVTVEFAESAKTINENGGSQTLTINFSDAATKDGEIALTVSPANAGDFISIPTKVSVTKGNTFAQINVTPVDNATIDGARQATITLSSPTSGFEIGTKSAITITIADDEGEVTANFETDAGAIAEDNATGIDVNILLSDAADAAGTIVVSFPADKASAFTSDPAFSGTAITVPVAASATSASFKIIPVNNADPNDDVAIVFTITGATGGVTVGSATTYTLTIADDDQAVATTIADLRAMYPGSDLNITSNIQIQGVVTSANDNVTSRNIYIQDATAAILIRFNNNNTLSRGDEVTINLMGATLTKFNELLQVSGNLPNTNATKVGDGTLPAYQVITIQQLNSGNFESQLVKIENVGFFDGNTTNNLRYDGGSGVGNNRFGNAAGDESVLRVESYAPFATDAIPLGFGTVQGIASVFNTTWQLIPQSANDIFASNESAVITTSVSDLSFGDVANSTTADLDFTVEGTSLSGDIVITASSYYTVSLDDATYSESVVVPAATANAGATTIFVRFSPGTGSNQTLAGSLTLKSLSASVKSVGLTGNETGNAASSGSLMIYEVYGGGGNSGATYTNDYVVLYNSTASAIDLTGYSLHYASSSGSFGTTNNSNLSGTIQAGDYFLIQLQAGVTVTDKPLPTPDLVAVLHGNASASINMSGTNGKIALVHGAADTSISGKSDAAVVDFVGYGSANDFEGTGAAGVLSNSSSAKRKTFVDTNDNSIDFEVVTPNLDYL